MMSSKQHACNDLSPTQISTSHHRSGPTGEQGDTGGDKTSEGVLDEQLNTDWRGTASMASEEAEVEEEEQDEDGGGDTRVVMATRCEGTEENAEYKSEDEDVQMGDKEGEFDFDGSEEGGETGEKKVEDGKEERASEKRGSANEEQVEDSKKHINLEEETVKEHGAGENETPQETELDASFQHSTSVNSVGLQHDSVLFPRSSVVNLGTPGSTSTQPAMHGTWPLTAKERPKVQSNNCEDKTKEIDCWDGQRDMPVKVVESAASGIVCHCPELMEMTHAEVITPDSQVCTVQVL